MKNITRRKFVQLGSITLAGVPLMGMTGKPEWYGTENAAGADNLYNLFQHPTGTARPFVRWWWSGLRIVKEELLRELDMLKALGVGGVEINSIAFPEPDDPMNYKAINWLSEEWIALLKIAVDGAKERGLICDIIVGSGWPFGGEFLTHDEQIQLLALGTKDFAPGQHTISKAELLHDMDELMTYKSGTMELTGLRLAPVNMDAFNSGISLNNQIGNAEIKFDVPEGEHKLYFTVKLTGFTAVTHGAPGASGPVLNHFSQPAVQKYLNRMSDAITAKLGSMGNYFRSIFIDSQELRGSNWCDDMLQEFKKRRGYDLEPYLPFVLFKINRKSTYNGNIIIENNPGFSAQAQDEINRVRYDFEITRLELFDERFLKTFLAWCRKNNVKSRVQAYGREYYPLESAMQLDIPECETWIHADVGGDLKENVFGTGRGYRPINKFASSAAHLTGKKLISCEEITNTAMVYNATLERIKITGDQSNLTGVTHSIMHGFNYSPKDAPFPGWVRYGTFFNERNTWWPYLKLWVDYKTRLSAVFQHAEMQADVAILFPMADMWSKFGLQYQQYPQLSYPAYAFNIWEAVHQNGNSCDYINEQILQQSRFANGQLHYGARSYKMLLMPEVESVAPETVDALQKFAAAGGQIIFVNTEPVKSYGWIDHAAKNQAVQAKMQSLKQHYPNNAVQIAPPQESILNWYTQLQSKFKVTPFVQFDKPVGHVSQVYYKTPEADIFFISNYHLEKPHECMATFAVKNKTAWLWNPETGKRYKYPYSGEKNKLKISLDPTASILIVFTNDTQGETFVPIKAELNAGLTVSHPWTARFNHANGQTSTVSPFTLMDFKTDEHLKSFAGVVHYENTINIADPSKITYLNLGTVHGITEVTVNGQNLGTQWYGRRIFRVSHALKKGNNTISIKVITTLGNYMKSLTDNKDAVSWTKTQPLYSQGLIGPVTLSS